jgi:hypothetical protein
VRRIAAVTCVLLTVACKKGDEGTAPTGSASVAATASVSASASASVAEPGAPRSFTGTYTAARAGFYVPDGGEYAGVKFRGDDAGDALGDGNLTITIDKDGIVTGEGDGPLGAFTIAGIERDGDLTFSLRRKDANDLGPTGTGIATLTDGALDGTLRVSAYRAQVIREVTFKLKKKS